MTKLWVFRLGRLAWARRGYTRTSAIGGWRHLWWRFWWELRALSRTLTALEETHAQRLVEAPEYRVPKGRVMHWSSGPEGLAVCGADAEGLYWTRELAAATCKECSRIGGPIMLKHRLNTR